MQRDEAALLKRCVTPQQIARSLQVSPDTAKRYLDKWPGTLRMSAPRLASEKRTRRPKTILRLPEDEVAKFYDSLQNGDANK